MRRACLALCGIALAGCSGGDGAAMLLNQICNPAPLGPYYVEPPSTGTDSAACTVSGDATITDGLSSGATAVKLGPNGGDFRIRLQAIPPAFSYSVGETWSLDVLAASSRPEGSTLVRLLSYGSCGAACPPDPADVEANLTEDVSWVSVVSDLPTSEGQSYPSDAVLIFRGADIDILELRAPGYDQNSVYY